ncbi:SAV_2336 N-terminal domain-related protein [Streptomyces sp. NBC_01198]|uniref:SAV_2336 N-terminal domain-related protein n=1 Tax=Streptomyces sp. NBC_01198 TaxID=2903769 RepID=UPI002E0E18EE|nr:SAV_2336 family protein [Streptomyces sp. NBC_01198]
MDAEPNRGAGQPAEPPAEDATGGRPLPDPLAELVGRLTGAGLEPGTGELADALWLARWSVPTVPEPVPAEREQGPAPGSGGGPGGAPGDLPQVPADGTDGRGRSLVPPERDEGGMLDLYPGVAEPGRVPPGPAGLTVAVPEATALPRLLELQSALRPLQRYRSPARPLRETLDESATAERSALAGGLLLPVFRPVGRGNATMQLLMDASSSMYVWERMLRELGGVFERLGAFHEVQIRHLHATPDGAPAVSSRFDPEPSALRSADQLIDPTGRRVTLLVSDCAGPLWRSGQAHRLLHRLAGHGPVAVLQPLPARLWSRTRLPVSYGVLHRAEGPLPAAPLRFSAGTGGFTVPPAGDALPVPVLPPTAQALGAWARLLAGIGAGEVPAAVGWVRSDQPVSPGRPRRATVPPTALVGRFRSAASPAAAQLAVYLSAAPLFLPVMQLVQRTMLPDSGPAELAEVLLSGLVVKADDDDHRWYEFAPGVRDVLLGPLGLDEARLVLKHCSEYVEQRFGRSGPNFPALAITQLTDGPSDAVSDAAVASAARDTARAERAAIGVDSQQPFAEVAARVLERFVPLAGSGAARDGGAHPGAVGGTSSVVLRARELVARFRDEGMVQNLMEAVQLLRRAAAEEFRHGTDPELWSELAEQLIRLWRLRGGPGLLREAQDAAETAAAHPGSVKARAVRAGVLRASADDRAAVGDTRAALDLLRRADRELTAVCASPGLERHELLAATLERVEILEDQWLISGDAVLLEETVGSLEAFADSWPPTEDRPSQLALAHGRALLRLAGAAVDREREQVCAEQAATSFAAGLDALEREDAGPEQLVAAILALVDALLVAGGRLAEAQRLVDRALGESRDRLLRASILTRSGRIRVARHAEGGPPGELEAAAGRFAEACRLTPRDRPEYSNLVAEWGAALLDRAALPGGELFVNRAVLVLRDCRMETPADDPRLPARLLMLGRALVLRYTAEGDLVDLREAEHVLLRALQPAVEPGQIARISYELGEVHRLGYGHTRRTERLDLAAEAYRRAADAADTAATRAFDPHPMVRLAAQAHHWRGVVYVFARRPRAAADAYRAALAGWRQLPDEGGEAGRRTAERLAALTSP